MRFKYTVFKGDAASQVVIDAKLPGSETKSSGMTNCAKLFDANNAMVVEVSRHGNPVFLFQYGYLKGLIQYIIVDSEYEGKKLFRRFIKHIIKNFLPKNETLYTTFYPIATGRRIKFTDDDDLYTLVFEDSPDEGLFKKYEVVKKQLQFLC